MLLKYYPGGASASFTIESGTVAPRRALPASSSPAKNVAPAAAAGAPERAVEWPRAGWGPGSLTISRPPRAAGASETVLSNTAVVAALKLSANAAPGVRGVVGSRGGALESVGRAPGAGDSGGGGGGAGFVADGRPGGRFAVPRDHWTNGNSAAAAAAAASSIGISQSQSSARPMTPSEEAWGGGGGGGGGNRGVTELSRGEHPASGVAEGGEEGGDLARDGFNKRPEEREGEDSAALNRAGDDIIGRIFCNADDTNLQEGGLATDGSKAVAEEAGGSFPQSTVDGDGTGGVRENDPGPGGEAAGRLPRRRLLPGMFYPS